MLRIIRQWIIDTLGFTRSEANGTLILIMIVLITTVIPKIYILNTHKAKEKFTYDPEKLDAWTNELQASIRQKEIPPIEEEPLLKERFDFNPNTATYDELIRLGFTSKSASNILAYRNSGGKFYTKKDLKKIYGISLQQIDNVWNLINLPENLLKPEKDKPGNTNNITQIKSTAPFDLNLADTIALQSIQGIGTVLSKRIIKFRDKLGGFHSGSQLNDVYGLDSLVINRILEKSYINASGIRKINLNTDSLQSLYQHPYIDYKLAKAIYNFRIQRGQLDSVAQIKSIKILDESLYNKIYPYLSLNP